MKGLNRIPVIFNFIECIDFEETNKRIFVIYNQIDYLYKNDYLTDETYQELKQQLKYESEQKLKELLN